MFSGKSDRGIVYTACHGVKGGESHSEICYCGFIFLTSNTYLTPFLLMLVFLFVLLSLLLLLPLIQYLLILTLIFPHLHPFHLIFRFPVLLPSSYSPEPSIAGAEDMMCSGSRCPVWLDDPEKEVIPSSLKRILG